MNLKDYTNGKTQLLTEAYRAALDACIVASADMRQKFPDGGAERHETTIKYFKTVELARDFLGEQELDRFKQSWWEANGHRVAA